MDHHDGPPIDSPPEAPTDSPPEAPTDSPPEAPTNSPPETQDAATLNSPSSDAGDPVGAASGAPPEPAPPQDKTGTSTRRLLLPLLSVAAIIAAIAAFWSARALAPPEPDLVLGAPTEESPFAGFMISPARPAPEVELSDGEGGTVTLEDLKGQVVLLFFGYTFCPDVCPQTMTKLTLGLREVGDRAEDVTVLFVSVDPERDTPETIAQFLAGYDPSAIGVTGDLDTLNALAKDYAVTFFKDVEEGKEPDPRFYTITHSATVFLIDQEGNLRASFLGPYTPDDVAHDVGVLIDEADQGQG